MQVAFSSWRRPVTLTLLSAMVGSVLAACGGSTAGTTATTAPAPTAAAEVATTAPAPTAAAEPTSAPAPTAGTEPTTAAPVATNGGITETNGLKVAAATSCDAPYTGIIKEIAAVDAATVRFTMCRPDPIFRAKAAFASFAIEPSEYIESTGGTGAILEKPIGTGPYTLESWNRGESITFKRNDNYWGEKAKNGTLVFRWSTEAAARLLELQSGTVDGIDNVGPEDFDTVRNDSSLQLLERPGLNTMYVGMNNTSAPFDNEKVRQAIAMGIDRDRIVKNFYPAGSEVAKYFTPCAIPNGCVGDEWYTYDPAKAKQLLTEAGFPNGFDTVLNYRDVVRGYLPNPGTVAQDIQSQLKTNLGINVTIEVQESGTFLDNAAAGSLKGLFLLGWGADYPDQTNFLDYHFGESSSKSFGNKFDDIVSQLKQGAALADEAARKPFYEQANNAIKTHVPMIPVAHGGSAVAFKADAEGANTSPLGNEQFSVINPGGRDTMTWMQNGEPAGLYCADETDGEALRACAQVTESLLAYKLGGTDTEPRLATSCDPNTDYTVWTCKLRTGVKFSDGSDFDANDVVESWYVQWDAASPLHKGRDGAFTYFTSLWGGFLNAPPEAQ